MKPMQQLSDRHSKEEIQRLSSKNDALTAALNQAHAAHGDESNLPPTEYPRLPSHTQFAPLPPSPQAQQVAAQNQQLMAPPAQPLVPVPPVPQGNAFPRPAPARPDLSALDEAYRRMGGVPRT